MKHGTLILNVLPRIGADQRRFQITDQAREDTNPKPWLRIVHSDDLEKFDKFFDELIACKGLQTIETRLKKTWTFHSEEDTGDPIQHTVWILASGYSEMNSNGGFGSAVCWITDISTQKAVERGLDARMKKALDLKRQQENFVDNICHEIRNPASAMLNCAEEIGTYLQDCLTATAETMDSSVATLKRPRHSEISDWLRASLDAAQTIVDCVNHQRSIVDDVLTLSKLDSNLLPISPIVVEPGKVVSEAVKLFEGEMRNASIKWSVHRDDSLRDLDVDWVLLDPGRIHQVIMYIYPC
jgi:signal transduction histidine kinase